MTGFNDNSKHFAKTILNCVLQNIWQNFKPWYLSKSVDHFATHNLIGRIKYLYLSQWPIAVADIPEDEKTRVVAETVKKRYRSRFEGLQ